MKDKDLLKMFKKNGWTEVRVHGSHHIMKKGNQTEGDVPPTVQLPDDEIADAVAQNESEDSDDTNIDIP